MSVKDKSVWIDCSHDMDPKDYTTQAAYKKHLKFKKVRTISAQAETDRDRRPGPMCNVVTPQSTVWWYKLPKGTDNCGKGAGSSGSGFRHCAQSSAFRKLALFKEFLGEE